MSSLPDKPSLWVRSITRFHARMAGRGKVPTGFVSQPEPRSIGQFARGRQLVAGNFNFAGHLVEAGDNSPWGVPAPDTSFSEEIQGFLWLDDLAAVSDANARAKAQAWTWEWIKLYGTGTGQGWTPDVTGRRLIRWINHAIFLLSGDGSEHSEKFYRSLARQTHFLNRRWSKTTAGLPRIEALTGLIYAGLSLTGMEAYVDPATQALGRECEGLIDDDGALATRNPEELLEVFTLLNWAALALNETGRMAHPSHSSAIERITPVLRTLRHADGGLARFHGGGRGLEGRLDTALATSGVRAAATLDQAMGYARISSGRTSLIMDADVPPLGVGSHAAHASTLAFELTSGRRPLIVNCGAGLSFGEDWRRAGRASASHSVLGIEGYSSSRLGAAKQLRGRKRELLEDGPTESLGERRQTEFAIRQQASHDGYRKTHGLVQVRTLEMTHDGRGLAGEDLLLALNDADKSLFQAKLDETSLQGVPYTVRFHLHPDVDAAHDMGGAAVSLALKSGEIWVFRHDGGTELSLQPSVYLENGRLKPRATQQIVLRGAALSDTTRVRWSLAKAQETPLSVRDLKRDDPLSWDDQDE